MTKQEILDRELNRLSIAIDLFTSKCFEIGLDIDETTLGVEESSGGYGLIVCAEYSNPTELQQEWGIFVRGYIPTSNPRIEYITECTMAMYPPRDLPFHELKGGKWIEVKQN
jgi:hypothetical protein